MMAEMRGRRLDTERRTLRLYPVVAGPPEPVTLFGRLARRGIRLQRCGDRLLAELPADATTIGWWPPLEKQVSRYAGSLAVTVALAHRFSEGRSAFRVAALLAELRSDVPEILLETIGGEARMARLIALPLDGVDLDLACVACCRSLAIRAIHQGRGLTGLLANRESDGEERGRRYVPLDAPAGSGVLARRATERRGPSRP